MGPLVYEEADGMAVNGHLEDEVSRGARLHRRPYHAIVVRMYQSEQEGKCNQRNHMIFFISISEEQECRGK